MTKEKFDYHLELADKAIEKANKGFKKTEVICNEIIELQTIRESKNELL